MPDIPKERLCQIEQDTWGNFPITQDEGRAMATRLLELKAENADLRRKLKEAELKNEPLNFLILAGNYDEFRHWVVEIWPVVEVKYIAGYSDVLGMHPDRWRFVKTGTWFERKDKQEILDRLAAVGFQV